MRLIDTNALESKMHELYVQPRIDLWQVVSAIAHTPTIDAVEVVRCRDCLGAMELSEKEKLSSNDDIKCAVNGGTWSQNDFCSYGEKAEE